MQAGSGFTAKAMSPADQMKAQKKALQAATIRLLEKARRDAAEQGVDLSEWENAFIEDVGERVKTYGRAFADPDKGALNGTLSMRQGQKLKEIRKKVKTKGNARGSDEPDI
jgi:Zn-dependent oligopeptidase